MAETVIAGLISGVTSQTLCHPLDTLKTLAQNGQPVSLPKLFNGVVPMIAKSIVRSPLSPFLNHLIRSQLGKEPLPLPYVVIAGSLTGFFQTPISHGFDFFKIQQQSNSHDTMKLLRSQPRAILNGFWATAARNLVGCATYYLFYEAIARFFLPGATFGRASDMGGVKIFIGGGIAGCITWAVQIPLDTVKTQMQTQCFEGATYKSVLKDIGGIKSFYRGFVPICIRSFAYNGINMVLFEKLCEWLREERTFSINPEHYNKEMRDFIHW